jgi:hypothetical protein
MELMSPRLVFVYVALNRAPLLVVVSFDVEVNGLVKAARWVVAVPPAPLDEDVRVGAGTVLVPCFTWTSYWTALFRLSSPGPISSKLSNGLVCVAHPPSETPDIASTEKPNAVSACREPERMKAIICLLWFQPAIGRRARN